MMPDEFPKVIFFFGAGASKPAGVGTTLELVKEFREFLAGRHDMDLLTIVLDEIIKHLGHEDIDVEQLMTALEKLTTRENDELLKFYDSGTFKIKTPTVIAKLLELLRLFIQKTTSVKEDKINFLKPLRSFPNPVTIFSVNYDTAIEQFCNVYKLRYTDGFDYEWNPKLFTDVTFDFHLKKIHGSIMWYQTDNGNYVKLPLPPEDKIKMIFGEKATPLILYPMQKWAFVEPLLELLLQFKTQLAESDFVIIVGYSFRDSHITRLLHESARKNRKMVVILVDPHARELYEKHLRYYASDESQKKISSLLENRVLCLQYGFEQIIGTLKELVVNCNGALKNEESRQKYLLEGHSGSSSDLVHQFSKIEFLDKADEWKNQIKWAEEVTLKGVNTKLLTSSLTLFVIAEIQNNTESANYWLKHFLDAFNFLNLLIPMKITIASNVVRFSNLDNISNYSGTRYHMDDLQIFLESQKNLRGHIHSQILNDIIAKITIWLNYFHNYSRETMLYADYIETVRNFYQVFSNDEIPVEISELIELLDENFIIKNFTEKSDEALEIIKKIEFQILKSIFSGHNNLTKYVETIYALRYSAIAQIR